MKLQNTPWSIVRFESGKKVTFWNPPPRRSCRLIRVLHSFLRKVAQKMRRRSFEPTFMAIGKTLELSDKIYTACRPCFHTNERLKKAGWAKI